MELGQMEPEQIIHKHEKALAIELLKIFSLAIRDENLFIRQLRDEMQEYLKTVILSQKPTKKEVVDLASGFQKFLQLFKKTLPKYFESLYLIAKATAFAIEKEYRKIARELGELKESFEFDDKIFSVDKEAIYPIIDRIWAADGLSYLDRIETIQAGAGPIFQRIFREGLEEGEGYREITRRIKREITAKVYQIERIVRTEGQRIQNDLTLEVYKKNKKQIEGLEYTSALDVRTCLICGSNDRRRYWWEGTPSVKDAPYIPVHPNCRCSYIPISKFWKDSGIGSLRASQYGPITGSYDDFLQEIHRSDPDWAKKHLGGFYDSWLRGEKSVSDLRLIDDQPKIPKFLLK